MTSPPSARSGGAWSERAGAGRPPGSRRRGRRATGGARVPRSAAAPGRRARAPPASTPTRGSGRRPRWTCWAAIRGSRSRGRARRPGRRTRERAASVRRKLGPPGAELLERVPKACLGGLLVERCVDVGNEQRLGRGREALEFSDLRPQRIREREPELVEELQGLVAHDDDQLRLDDVQLALEP